MVGLKHDLNHYCKHFMFPDYQWHHRSKGGAKVPLQSNFFGFPVVFGNFYPNNRLLPRSVMVSLPVSEILDL